MCLDRQAVATLSEWASADELDERFRSTTYGSSAEAFNARLQPTDRATSPNWDRGHAGALPERCPDCDRAAGRHGPNCPRGNRG
jgi:hypothetical protein